MKILTAKQLSEADQISIKKQNISSEQLMERAANLVFDEIHKRLQLAQIPIKIFCGIGNNGGDGLVVARKLIEEGYQVKVFIVNYSDKRTDDFLSNYQKLKDLDHDWPIVIKGKGDFPEIHRGDFVIDSIFGIGLNRPIEGWVCELVHKINASGAFTLAIDMPSGLYADKVPGEGEAVIEADFTLSFQTPKLVFYLPETMDYVGDFQILDIGLDPEFLMKIESQAELIERSAIINLYKSRKKNSHKGDYGHLLVAGGSYGKIGSVNLTATAAMNSGCGLCTLYIPKCGYEIIQTSLPEAMVITDDDENYLTNYSGELDPDTWCFGMGAGTKDEVASSFKKILESTNRPVLVDADGLNILSRYHELIDLLPSKSILTPHPGELKRLIGEWDNDFDKLNLVKQFSEKHDVILVVKGAYTFIVYKQEIYINTSGNQGMATAGSGDALAGVIASLMAQKYDPVIAAIMGVYLHGLSGDLVASKNAYEGVTASRIAKNMGNAFQSLLEDEG